MSWTGWGLPSLILVFLLGACGGNAGNSGRTPGRQEAGAAGLAATSGTGGSRDSSGGTGGKMDADSGGTIAAGGRAVTTGGASSGGRNAGPTGGTLVDGGSEGEPPSGISNAEIVDSFGVPAIEGDRMLRVAPGAGALLHLRRTGGETQLVMDVRKTNECSFGPQDGALEISAAVIGNAAVPSEALTLGDAPTDVTVDGSAMQVGEVGTVSWALPSGNDVLVYLRGDYYYGAGCLLVGALVDNVRLQ